MSKGVLRHNQGTLTQVNAIKIPQEVKKDVMDEVRILETGFAAYAGRSNGL